MAKTAPEKIAALEEMLAIMPKHKGTDHLRAELRARIAKLSQIMDKKSAVHRASMVIEKEGAGQVAVIGLPNAGKSQLVAVITNASRRLPNIHLPRTPPLRACWSLRILKYSWSIPRPWLHS